MRKVISTLEEARRLKIGEPARLKPGTLKLAPRPIEEETYRCAACRLTFVLASPETPKFCPGCGARWNGKVAAAAVEEG